ncbi:MAG: ABC transporter ATP-binding protein [Verrucomicrobiales bacterium]|nr:ABC transporter ATP-binding protein [Verrucomicrobiales bacterium]
MSNEPPAPASESSGEESLPMEGPPPGFDLDPKEMRRHCFRLIREVIGSLGWKYKLWIPAAMLLSAVHLLPPRFLLFFTERTQALSETGADDFIKMLVIFGVGVGICQWIALVFDSILSEWLRLTVSIRMKQDAVDSLSRTRIDSLDSAQRGDWMTRLSSDIYNAEEFLTASLPGQITNATMMIGSAALFFYYSGPIAFIPLLAALFLGWFNIAVQRKMGPTLSRARMLEGGVFQSMIETFEGLRTIRSYGAEGFTRRKLTGQLNDVYVTGMSITRSMALLIGVTEFVGQLIVTGLLTLVAFQVIGETLTAENALVYPFYLTLFLGAAKGLVGSAYDWNRFFIEGGRLASLLYDEENKEADREELFGGFESETASVKRFSAENVFISYGDNPPVIRNQGLELNRGEIVALMGESGCGKSTLTESFAGLRQANEGSFTATMNDGEQRSFEQAPPFLGAFVEQQPYLFVGSIRDNITLGHESVSDDDVRAALAEVGLAEIVERRGGLDHVLTDRGRNMSVGQQYRLALCRALVCGRPFLLMDEPFAALDVESVELVVKAMKEERAGGTGILLITHLLPDGLEADRIVELVAHRD